MEIKDEGALRLADLSDWQLDLEIKLIRVIISTFPNVEPPSVILTKQELSDVFPPDEEEDKKFHELNFRFLRFQKIGFVDRYNPIGYFSSNGIVKFEVNEGGLRAYLAKLEDEILRRGLNTLNGPVLQVSADTTRFIFLMPNVKPRVAEFRVGTNQHKILMHFVRTPHKDIGVNALIDLLKQKRNDDGGNDRKGRVHDVIKAIRDKLGKNVLHQAPDGFILDCKVLNE